MINKLIPGSVPLLFLFLACSNPAIPLRQMVGGIGDSLQGDFNGVRSSLETMVDDLEAVYAQTAVLDLSTSKMDKADGGTLDYYRTENGVIYYNTSSSGCAFYASPSDSVITEAIKREARIMQYQESVLAGAYNKHADICTISFFGIHQPSSIAIMYPYMNVLANFPPKLDFTGFHWYSRGINSPGAYHWSEAPFADLASGWVMDVAKSVRSQNTVVGTAVISVNMNKLVVKYLLDKEKYRLMLLGNDLTIIGLTPPAKEVLSVKVLQDFDYIKQMKENTFVGETFKLDGSGQTPDIRDLAERILGGETDFSAKIGQAKKHFLVCKIPEVGFYVVGIY